MSAGVSMKRFMALTTTWTVSGVGVQGAAVGDAGWLTAELPATAGGAIRPRSRDEGVRAVDRALTEWERHEELAAR